MRARLALSLILGLLAGCGAPPANQAASSPPPIQFAQADPDPLRHGERVATILGCNGCHGADMTGAVWEDNPDFGIVYTSNLTRVAHAWSAEEFTRTVVTGRRPDGAELWMMPSQYFTQLDADDLNAVVAFIRSRPATGEDHPRPDFRAGARAEIASGLLKSAVTAVREEGDAWPPDAGPSHALGRYLARATCAECHNMNLEGGTPYPGAPPRPSLRSIMAAYDQPQFRRLLHEGIAIGDRRLGLMGEVSRGRFRHFTDGELNALHAYLRAIVAG